jgi:hypothetical protein
MVEKLLSNYLGGVKKKNQPQNQAIKLSSF